MCLAATASDNCGRVAVEAAPVPLDELLLDDELLDEELLLEELEEELLELLELELELDEDELTVGPTEHQADVEKLLLGKAEPTHAKLPVLVA